VAATKMAKQKANSRTQTQYTKKDDANPVILNMEVKKIENSLSGLFGNLDFLHLKFIQMNFGVFVMSVP
jgi:hypothetical protein